MDKSSELVLSNKWKTIKKLSQGTFGVVYLATSLKTNEQVNFAEKGCHKNLGRKLRIKFFQKGNFYTQLNQRS